MNQTFSPGRFGRLLRKYFTDHRGQLLVNLALLACGLAAASFLFYSFIPQAVDGGRPIFFFMIGWAAWYVFIWQQTEALNQRERAVTYLMQPASKLEKIAMIWLISGVGFLVVYLLLFTVLDAVGVAFVNHRQWTPEQLRQIGSYKLVPWYQSNDFVDMQPLLVVLSTLLHPFGMAFSLTFRRYALPLVAVLAFTLVVGGFLANSAILGLLTGSESAVNAFPFEGFRVRSSLDQQYRPVDLPQPIGNQIRYLVGITAVVLLYATAYFRLKEREV